MRKSDRALAAAALALAMPALADDLVPLGPDDLLRNAAVVTVFVPPIYPDAALAAGVQGTVDVEGRVRPDGTFEVFKLKSSPDREDLRQAVREAAKLWILQPGFTPECTFQQAEGRVRVWFEIRGQEPVISFSAPRREKRKVESHPMFKPEFRRNPEYPRDLVHLGLKANVLALIRVGRDGTVENVDTVPNGAHRLFHQSTVRALRRWRFPPVPEGRSPWCGEYELSYYTIP